MRIPRRLTQAFLLSLVTVHGGFAAEPNVVIQWNQTALQAVRDSTLGPPMVARACHRSHLRL